MIGVTTAAARRMKLVIEYRPVADLRADPRNARLHSDEQIEQLVGSIRRFGFVNPVLVREGGVIVAGEGRWRAARKLGLAEVPVIELEGLDEGQCRALALADNRIALNASWDAELLAQELAALMAGGENAAGLGFDERELDALMNPEGATVEAVRVGPLEDRFWIAVRGPMKDQAAALQRLTQVMADFPAIEVELGTVGSED
jgi:ParB-like chromosome segregation protein Spo0J